MSAIANATSRPEGLPTFVIRLRVLLLYEASGGRFDPLVLAIADGFSRRHLGACFVPEPVAPFRPPASRHALRSLEPAIGVGPGRAANPVIALVLRRGVDYPGDVPAGTEHEGRVVGEQFSGGVRGVPRDDVVFARC